jgi:hypothetical protein
MKRTKVMHVIDKNSKVQSFSTASGDLKVNLGEKSWVVKDDSEDQEMIDEILEVGGSFTVLSENSIMGFNVDHVLAIQTLLVDEAL